MAAATIKTQLRPHDVHIKPGMYILSLGADAVFLHLFNESGSTEA